VTRADKALVRILEPHAGNAFVQYLCEPRSDSIQYARATVDSTCPVKVSCGFRRCADFDPSNAPGQDFVAVRASPAAIVAVVSDGVSQSFFGDLAAAAVSRVLLEELWAHHHESVDVPRLDTALQHAASLLDREVAAVRLPAEMPSLQKDALERTRKSGSQAVFAAIVFKPESQTCDVLQVGDVRVVAQVRGQVEIIEAPPHERWSSASQESRTRHVRLERVTKVLLKTDGVGAHWAASLESEILTSPESFAAVAGDLYVQDDLAFASVVTSAQPQQPRTFIPPPKHTPGRSSPKCPPGGSKAKPTLPLIRIGAVVSLFTAAMVVVAMLAFRSMSRSLRGVQARVICVSGTDRTEVAILRLVNRTNQDLLIQVERDAESAQRRIVRRLGAKRILRVPFEGDEYRRRLRLQVLDTSGAPLSMTTVILNASSTCTVEMT
jgi:serine/threonine protein phosphatase PrpC